MNHREQQLQSTSNLFDFVIIRNKINSFFFITLYFPFYVGKTDRLSNAIETFNKIWFGSYQFALWEQIPKKYTRQGLLFEKTTKQRIEAYTDGDWASCYW